MKRFLLIFLILLTGSVAFGESYYMDEITTVGGTKINIHITCCYCNRLDQSLVLTFFFGDDFAHAKEHLEKGGICINKIIPACCFFDETEIRVSPDNIYSIHFRDFGSWKTWGHDDLMKMCYGL